MEIIFIPYAKIMSFLQFTRVRFDDVNIAMEWFSRSSFEQHQLNIMEVGRSHK